jgi:hypothetical protein
VYKEAVFMSLLGNVRQTLGEAAATALDVGQNLSAQAQAQLNIKKLQLDQAKRLHELGAKTYEWYKTGSLVVSGQVPHDVRDLCHQLDGIQHQLDDEQHKLEEMKQQAAIRGAAGTEDTMSAPQSDSELPAIGMTSGSNNVSGVSGNATSYEVYDTSGGAPYPPSAPYPPVTPTAYGAAGSSVPPASASTYAMTPGPDVSPIPAPPGPGPDLPRTPSESPVSPTLPPVPPSGPGIPSNPDLPPTMPPPGPPSGRMPGGPSGPTM